MPDKITGVQRLDEYPREDLLNRLNDLREQIKIKNERIAALESELKIQQDKEQQNIRDEINKFYPWMCEAIRLRRVSEAIGEELEIYQRRAEKAERGLRNLKKWLEIQGWGVGPSG